MTGHERAELITNLRALTGDTVRITAAVLNAELEYRVVLGKRRYRGTTLDAALMAALTDVAAAHATAAVRQSRSA